MGGPALPPKDAGGMCKYIYVSIYALGVCAHVCAQCSIYVCTRAWGWGCVCVCVCVCHMVRIVEGGGGGGSGGGPTNQPPSPSPSQVGPPLRKEVISFLQWGVVVVVVVSCSDSDGGR